MKVMGSAMMVFQSIVILLTVPVAIVAEGIPRNTAWGFALGLVALCLASVGRMRGPRRTAVVMGTVVQAAVILCGIWVHSLLVPGLIFLLVWLLAVRLSARTDLAQPLN